METNDKAQAILALVHSISGGLLEASKDGKIDISEAVQIFLANAPQLLALAGVKGK